MRTVKAMVKKADFAAEKIDSKAAYPLVFLLAFITANAKILGALSPFSVSFMAALPYSYSLWAFFGSLIGYMMFGGVLENISYIIAIIAVLSFKFFTVAVKKPKFNIAINSIVNSGIVLASGLFFAISIEKTTAGVIIATAQGFLAGAMTYFCSVAFKIAASGIKGEYLQKEQVGSLLVVISIMILALFGLDTGYINCGRILSVFLILSLMRSRGVSGALIGGVITGMCSLLYDSTFAPAASIIIIASFFGGLSKPLGRITQIAMFIVSATTFTIIAGAGDLLIYQMFDIFAATILFAAIPSSLVDKLIPVAENPADSSKDAIAVSKTVAAKLNLASGTIDELSGSVKKVSERMDVISAQNIESVYIKSADEVCKKCSMKMTCWESAFNQTMDAMNSFTKKLRNSNEIKTDDIPYALKSNCIKPVELINTINKNYQIFKNKERLARRVSQSRSIAVEQFNGIADMLCEISSELADISKYDSAAERKVEKIASEVGLVPSEICCIVDKFGRMCVDIYTIKSPSCSNEILADRISDALQREFELPSVITANGKTKISFFEKANYTIEFHAAQHAFKSNGVCGDSYEFFIDAKGYAHLILSDGMGSGKRAAVDSVMTCSLILKLIKAGFGLESALKLINASLIVKSDDESLATLDVAKFDLYLGTVSLYKAGAAATFIKKGNEIIRADSASLPIGILQNISFDKFTYRVNDGDIVLMVSDGVLTTGEEWIEAELELCAGKTAEELADRILREAKRRSQKIHSDDMTVLAAKIGKV